MGPILPKARGATFYFTFKSRPKLPFTGAMVMGVVVVVLLHSDLQDLLKTNTTHFLHLRLCQWCKHWHNYHL